MDPKDFPENMPQQLQEHIKNIKDEEASFDQS